MTSSEYFLATGCHGYFIEIFFYFTNTGKICDNPLLQDTGTFPDSVFSGVGNEYKDARITGGGWCPNTPSSVYLVIDLQKEYHITGVIIMPDKDQTKYSHLHYLEYRRDGYTYWRSIKV